MSGLLFAGLGCHHSESGDKGLVISSNVELKSYVHFAVGANGHKETQLFFPLLQIYDSTGHLVYASHDPRANASMLANLPNRIGGLQPIPGATLLMDVMKEMPEFEAHREDFLQARRITVLSVFLEACHACSVQEEALDDTERQLRDRGFNLLIIRVSRPT